MNLGQVKWYSERKGFGYIAMDDETVLFFSKCNIENAGFWRPKVLDRVSFEIVDTINGKNADRVKPNPR